MFITDVNILPRIGESPNQTSDCKSPTLFLNPISANGRIECHLLKVSMSR